jgi:hypothetical protein
MLPLKFVLDLAADILSPVRGTAPAASRPI